MDPREVKVFVKLGEECAEIQQELAKTLLHGPYSYNPLEPMRGTNRQRLEKELGDLMYWLDEAVKAGLVDEHMIRHWEFDKRQRIASGAREKAPPQGGGV
ncbi:hypothetical protein [Cupriavidus sp. DL-D2]|uniref:hypothetical protein n=1 Tax=Cupriavidus sp. DL-D2 TaxID=3144974 RepID=UPI003214BC64